MPFGQPDEPETQIADENELATDDRRTLRAVLTIPHHQDHVFIIRRRQSGGLFSDLDRQRFDQMVPHLQRALHIRLRLAASEARMQLQHNVVEILGIPLILLDRQGRILFANQRALGLLKRGDGIRDSGGIVQLADKPDTERLRSLINAAIEPPGTAARSAAVLSVARKGGRPLSLRVARLPQDTAWHGSFALLIIGDPDRPTQPEPELLAGLYDLTKAEARLLRSLLEGERLQEFATRYNISVNTAKTQLARLFQKTGHGRQADLIREVFDNPIWKIDAEGRPTERPR